MQCHAYTYVVSVHVVSYAYSILCHSYVTYIYSPLSSLPSLLCLPRVLCLPIVLSSVGVPSLLVSYARLHIPCHVCIFCLLALLPS